MKAGISSPARVHHGFHLSVIRDPVHHVALYAVNSDLLVGELGGVEISLEVL